MTISIGSSIQRFRVETRRRGALGRCQSPAPLGFTLVELLVVIAIIATLIGLLLVIGIIAILAARLLPS